METLIIETEKTESGKLKVLMLFLTALEIPFKKSDTLDKRIQEAREEKAKGQLKTVNAQNVWESI